MSYRCATCKNASSSDTMTQRRVGENRAMGKRRYAEGNTPDAKGSTSALWDREFLLGIIDKIPDAIFAKDAEGRYIISNQSHLRLLGRKNRSEILGKTVYEIFPEQYAHGFDQDDKLVMRRGESLLNRE